MKGIAMAALMAAAVLAIGEDLPVRGAASREPARSWEWAFVSGNGRMGAMVFGHPHRETVIANHCRLFLPLGTREIVPDVEKGYRPAYDFMLAKAKEQGYPGLSWTDPFHPGFELTIDSGAAAAAALDGSKDLYVDLRHAERAACGCGELDAARTKGPRVVTFFRSGP